MLQEEELRVVSRGTCSDPLPARPTDGPPGLLKKNFHEHSRSKSKLYSINIDINDYFPNAGRITLKAIDIILIESCEISRFHTRVTTLQSLTNTKLSPHRFWPCHEIGLIKTIPMIPHNLYVSFKSASLYCGPG